MAGSMTYYVTYSDAGQTFCVYEDSETVVSTYRQSELPLFSPSPVEDGTCPSGTAADYNLTSVAYMYE